MPDCQQNEDVLNNSRGVPMILMAITMVAFLSATALAIDSGLFVNTRTDVQRVAHPAALHGVGSRFVFPARVHAETEARVEDKAIEYGAKNMVIEIPVTLLPQDVDGSAGCIEPLTIPDVYLDVNGEGEREKESTNTIR